MEPQHSPTKTLAQYKKPEVNLTAKDGLFIATECHLALFPDEDGDTALHLAVVRHDIDACKKLLELFKIAGKSIDVYNKLLQTPLHVAIITNQKDLVKLLLNNKADVNTPDRYGSTAYHLCAKYDHHECLVEILRFERESSGITNLNTRNYEGVTALHVAVMNSAITTFKLLVANGADIDAKDNKGGRSPLIYAIEMNVRSIVEMLLECDAAVGQQTYSGDTALHIASGRGLQDIVRLLLRRGADVTMKNTHSETPISLATSPSVSDILRTRPGATGSSPEMKGLKFADSQYASHIARNMTVPMPPQYLKLIGCSSPEEQGTNQTDNPMIDVKKRARKFKIENQSFESDDVIPPKRIAHDVSMASPGRVPNSSPILYNNRSPTKNSDKDKAFHSQGVTLKQEYIESNEQKQKASHKHFQTSSGLDDSIESMDENDVKKEFDSGEEIEIRMEEVEISSEEVIQSKSDDEDNKIEIGPASVADDQKQVSSYDYDMPYTHKLMQYSTNLMNKMSASRNLANNTVKDETDNVTITENKPVIIIRQPQVDMATALYRPSYSPSSSYKAFTPNPSPKISMLSQPQLSKSKSVPNSPQPLEANLYQLAREGLAVAAMANSSNQNQSGREYGGITSYLKARPSRQAKIKSGTEELQHLALQGLAVAAMNAKSESLHNQMRNRSSEDSPMSSGITAVPEHLTQVFKPAKNFPTQPPLLNRSNSMPPKHFFDKLDSGMDIPNPFEKSATSHFSSNNALLALAHANARKENVGQAISAISMGRVQSSSSPTTKQQSFTTGVPTIPSDVSENTKQNLRQAIMVKNSSVPPSKQLQKVYEGYDPKTRTFPSRLSIKIVPTINRTKAKVNGASDSDKVQTKGLPTTSSNERTVPKSPIIIKTLAGISIQMEPNSKTPQKNTDEVVSENLPQTTLQITKIHPSLQPIKTTREMAPTNTVAPLQVFANSGVPQSTRKSEQPTLISVAMAPIVTSRVSSPAGTAKQASNNTEVSPTQSKTNSTAQPTTVSIPFVQTTEVTNTSQDVNTTSTAAVIPQVPLGLPGGQLLNPSLSNFGLMGHHAAGASYLQPQIAYASYGKDLIPILMQPYQTPFPQYTIPVQASQVTTSTAAVQINPAYLASVSKVPSATIDPNLVPHMAMPVQDAQLRSLYPMTSPIYSSQVQQQLVALQHDQYVKALMHHQSLLAQNKPSIASVVLTSATVTPASKPVAAVTAVPVPKTSSSDPTNNAKIFTSEIDDQPLNLSKKAFDQPLNLMKSSPIVTAFPTSVRRSVIKVNSLAQNEPPKTTVVGSGLEAAVTQIYQQATPITSVIPGVGDQRVHPSVILPPPLLIPGATNPGPQAALSSLSLPPIHYVNGMPFILSLPPQL